jgi:hypothetical protein
MDCIQKMKNAKCKDGIPYQILASAESMDFNPIKNS